MCKKDLISVAPNAVSLYQLCDDEADSNETQSAHAIIQMGISDTPPKIEADKNICFTGVGKNAF